MRKVRVALLFIILAGFAQGCAATKPPAGFSIEITIRPTQAMQDELKYAVPEMKFQLVGK